MSLSKYSIQTKRKQSGSSVFPQPNDIKFIMVSTYHLVKLFKKATYERIQRNLEGNGVSPAGTSQQEDNVNKCRVCLKEGTLPIYCQELDISADICTFGDIKISEDDGNPKYICNSCHKLLEAAILFRTTAQKTDQILKKSLTKFNAHSNKSQNLASVHVIEEEKATASSSVLLNFFSSVISDNEISANEFKPMKSKRKITRVQCRICFKIITKAYYKEHFALHDRTVAKYVCDICGKSFRQRCSYRNHYFTHSSDFPYKCNLCPYRGRHSGLLKTHMRIHTGDYIYMCTECPARFLTKSNLNKHSLRHKEPMFKCDTCQRGFHSKLMLERHFDVDHLGIKNHICNVCGKAFGYRKAMMRHQLDVHKREKKLNGRTPAYIEAEIKKLVDTL